MRYCTVRCLNLLSWSWNRELCVCGCHRTFVDCVDNYDGILSSDWRAALPFFFFHHCGPGRVLPEPIEFQIISINATLPNTVIGRRNLHQKRDNGFQVEERKKKKGPCADGSGNHLVPATGAEIENFETQSMRKVFQRTSDRTRYRPSGLISISINLIQRTSSSPDSHSRAGRSSGVIMYNL